MFCALRFSAYFSCVLLSVRTIVVVRSFVSWRVDRDGSEVC